MISNWSLVFPDCENKPIARPPLVEGDLTPLPGLTTFQNMPIPCPAFLHGFYLYASIAGSFWVDILEPTSDDTVLNIVVQEQVTVTMPGLHHITLPPANRFFLRENQFLGIHSDAILLNSLRYISGLNISGYSDNDQLPAKHIANLVVTSETDKISSNGSIVLEDTFPPLNFHLDYGI